MTRFLNFFICQTLLMLQMLLTPTTSSADQVADIGKNVFLSLATQINFQVNDRIQYEPDNSDYWQTPAETELRKIGDCEDVAILKAHLLRKKGLKWGQLRLGIGRMDTKGMHVLLLVRSKDSPSSPWYILDNDQDGYITPLLARTDFHLVGSWDTRSIYRGGGDEVVLTADTLLSWARVKGSIH